jgi:hypothetical protein
MAASAREDVGGMSSGPRMATPAEAPTTNVDEFQRTDVE